MSKADIVNRLLASLGGEWIHCGNLVRNIYFKHQNRGEFVIYANGQIGFNSIYTKKDFVFFSSEQIIAIATAAEHIAALKKEEEQ